MNIFLRQMGTRILARRKELNWTQEQLAEKAGVTTQTISSAESGTKALRPENIANVSAALNCSTDYLLLGRAPPGKQIVYPTSVNTLTPLQHQCLDTIIDNYFTAILSEKNE